MLIIHSLMLNFIARIYQDKQAVGIFKLVDYEVNRQGVEAQ